MTSFALSFGFEDIDLEDTGRQARHNDSVGSDDAGSSDASQDSRHLPECRRIDRAIGRNANLSW